MEGVEALLTDKVVVQVGMLSIQVLCMGILCVKVSTCTEGTDKLLTIVLGSLIHEVTHVLDEVIVGFPFFIFMIELVDNLQEQFVPM